MSRVTPSAADSGDETPTPGAGRKPLRADAPAVRLGIGRLTVDLVVGPDGLLALAGDGVGSPPTTASVPTGTAAGLVELADTADARTAWDTAAWPLVDDTPTLPEVEA